METLKEMLRCVIGFLFLAAIGVVLFFGVVMVGWLWTLVLAFGVLVVVFFAIPWQRL